MDSGKDKKMDLERLDLEKEKGRVDLKTKRTEDLLDKRL